MSEGRGEGFLFSTVLLLGECCANGVRAKVPKVLRGEGIGREEEKPAMRAYAWKRRRRWKKVFLTTPR